MNIDYIHTLRIFETEVDNYGQHIITDYHDVPAVIEWNTAFSHSSNRAEIDSDATVLVDPTNSYIQSNGFRLEEAIVLANPYSVSEPQAWFKVDNSSVGQYHQTTGEVNTVYLKLKKTRPLEYVS